MCTVVIAAAFACIIAAIFTFIRGYEQVGFLVLSMMLAFGLTALVLSCIVLLKVPGGDEKYYASQCEELLSLRKEYADIRAQVRSEREYTRRQALQEQAQDDAQRRADEELEKQQASHDVAFHDQRTVAASLPAGNIHAAPVGAVDANSVRCPRCGCTQLSTEKRGMSGGSACCGALLLGPLGVLCGLHGANKVMITCLKCGHQWSRG